MNLRAPIQSLAVSLLVLIPSAAMAVDTTSEAYANGRSSGKVFGYLFIGVVVIAVLRKFLKK